MADQININTDSNNRQLEINSNNVDEPVKQETTAPKEVTNLLGEKVVENNEIRVVEPELTKVQNGVSLYTLFKLVDQESNKVDKPLFDIKLSGTKFLKYVTKISNNYVPTEVLNPWHQKRVDSQTGVVIGLNSEPGSFGRVNYRPSCYNYCTVARLEGDDYYTDGEEAYEQYDTSTTNRINNAERLRIYRGMAYESRRMENFLYADFDPDHDEFESYEEHGPSWLNNRGRVYRFGLSPLEASELSYITDTGIDYTNLNYDKTKVKELTQKLGYANFVTANKNFKKAYEILYNMAPKSTLDYSPIVEQLKLLLYVDAFTTGYDMIENHNSGDWQAHVYKDDERNIIAFQNTNNSAMASRQYHLAWCTWRQFANYQDMAIPANPDMRYSWEFVPILYEWLQKPNWLMTYVLSLLPYPVINAGMTLNTIDFDRQEINGTVVTNNSQKRIVTEHMSSRIQIDGHLDICFVIINAPEDLTGDENFDELPGVFTLTLADQEYRLPNLDRGLGREQEDDEEEEEEESGGNQGNWLQLDDFKPIFIHWLELALQGNGRDPIKLLSYMVSLDGWEIYADLLPFIAYMTTRDNTLFSNGLDITKIRTQENMSFIPNIPTVQAGYHGRIQESDFQQKCFRLLGLVRQKSAPFLRDMQYLQFSQMMYANRLVIADTKADFVTNGKNEIPAMDIVARRAVDIIGNQKYKASLVHRNHYFEISNMILDKRFGQQLKYIFPNIVYNPDQDDGDLMLFNEYSNIEDWCDFMSQDIMTGPTYTFTVNKEITDKYGLKIVPDEDNYYFLHGGGTESQKKTNNFFNDVLKRTMPLLDAQDADQRWFYCSSKFGYEDYTRTMFTPVVLAYQLTWNAGERIENLTRFPAYYPVDVVNGAEYAARRLPYLRVMDYTLPTFDRLNGTLLCVACRKGWFNQMSDFVCVKAWNVVGIMALTDYENAPVFPEIKA